MVIYDLPLSFTPACSVAHPSGLRRHPTIRCIRHQPGRLSGVLLTSYSLLCERRISKARNGPRSGGFRGFITVPVNPLLSRLRKARHLRWLVTSKNIRSLMSAG